jgi:hypothetical protein
MRKETDSTGEKRRILQKKRDRFYRIGETDPTGLTRLILQERRDFSYTRGDILREKLKRD